MFNSNFPCNSAVGHFHLASPPLTHPTALLELLKYPLFVLRFSFYYSANAPHLGVYCANIAGIAGRVRGGCDD
jgi:hypothetical protein